ncbi:hypothetical protein HBI23_047730 [Parastagonospora nodorum]|nr:hypothetical protein HBI12_030970 [Parastagonospora nodorum]KAH5454049.1 hypothetical protein HBI47_013730 [Parastagonospora nodorum]KAH5686104.1 hypothetical protein HBI23_047730 [Parastagonospora nodorum]
MYAFIATLADAGTAAVSEAPLQAGFSYDLLYEKAAVSVLFSNLTVVDSMALAFSQTFLTLASGVYARALNLEQRWRTEGTVTKVRKGLFYFIVVYTFLYAFVALVITVITLTIFWRRNVRELQVQLMPKY